MKQILATLFAAFVSLTLPLVITRVQAQQTSTPEGIDQLDVFLGAWNCSGKSYASGAVPPPATTGQINAEKAVAGQWLHIRYDESASATNLNPLHIGEYMGYDAATQKFLAVSVDNLGGYSTETSAGWEGNAITFEGTAVSAGENAGIRETYTEIAPDVITHSAAVRGEDGQWIKTDEESCRKAT